MNNAKLCKTTKNTVYNLTNGIPFHIRLFFGHSLILFGNLSLLSSYAMVMRPKKAETAVHGC